MAILKIDKNRMGALFCRGPPPTCTLPLPKGSSVSMAAFNEQSWAPKLADCLISEPGNVVMGKSDGRFDFFGQLDVLHPTDLPDGSM